MLNIGREKEMKNWQKLLKKENLIFGGLLVIGTIFCYTLFFQKKEKVIQTIDEISLTSESLEEPENKQLDENIKMYVDIKGAVNLPGMYEVTSDMRVLNVIDLAGGLKNDADDKQINFSARVEDQMIIYVPKEGEVLAEVELPQTGTGSASSSAGGKESNDKVNLNLATKEELMTLNGVGEKKAEKIIDYREENGSFKVVEDLKNVNGFGEKSFESLKSYITI